MINSINLDNIDYVLIFIWLFFAFIIGFLPGKGADYKGFWLNSKKTKLNILIFTIVSTQIGGGTIVGIASSSYSSGLGFGIVALLSTLVGFIVIGLFAEKIKRLADEINAYTLADIIGHFYGKTVKILTSIIILFAYFALLASQIVSVTTLFVAWEGSISWYLALALAGIGTLLYCAFAGLKGDLASDVFHFWGMAIVLFAFLLPGICQNVNVIDILSSLPISKVSPLIFGGYSYLIFGIIFGAIIPLVSVELWLRIFASQDSKTAKKAYIISAITVIPFYLLPMFIGLLSISTYQNVDKPDNIMIMNIMDSLGPGFRGLGIACLFSVTISTINTYVVVLASTVYNDILNRNKENQENLRESRYFTLGIALIGMILALLWPNVVNLILAGFYCIAVIFPIVCYEIYVIFKKNEDKVEPKYHFWTGTCSLVLGFVALLLAQPYLGNNSFIAGLLFSIVGLRIGMILDKKVKDKLNKLS